MEEILITLDNIDVIKKDYHREVIKLVLELKKWDRVFYTYKPKQMSKFKLIEFYGAYQGQEVITLSHHQLTYHTIMNIYYDNKAESNIDNIAKEMFKNLINKEVQYG